MDRERHTVSVNAPATAALARSAQQVFTYLALARTMGSSIAVRAAADSPAGPARRSPPAPGSRRGDLTQRDAPRQDSDEVPPERWRRQPPAERILGEVVIDPREVICCGRCVPASAGALVANERWDARDQDAEPGSEAPSDESAPPRVRQDLTASRQLLESVELVSDRRHARIVPHELS